VKGVGVRAVENIIGAREEGGSFQDLFAFCERIDTRLVNKGAIEALIKAGALDGLGGSRAQLMAGLEDAISVANARQRDAAAGQMTLFGAFESDAQVKEEVAKLPEVAPWPQPQLLQYEKEVLGMYVTSHPLAEYAEQIHYYSNANSTTLGQVGYSADVTIGGIIARVRYCVTKNGRAAGARMAMFTLEDLHGTAEGVIFPDALAEYEDLVQPDRMVFVRGKVDMRRDEPSIKVFAVYEMERAEEHLTKQVCIELGGEMTEVPGLKRLKELLARHGGKCPVQVELEARGGMRVVLGLDVGVRPGAGFCRELEALVGRGHYQLHGVLDRPGPVAAEPRHEEAAMAMEMVP
jgi:DNA polymerase-3 subunit alpha